MQPNRVRWWFEICGRKAISHPVPVAYFLCESGFILQKPEPVRLKSVDSFLAPVTG